MARVPFRLLAFAAAWSAAAARGELRFLTLGDWGAPDEPYMRPVAAAMAATAEAANASMLLALGDNFYEDGVMSVNDSQWKETYQEVYNFSSLQIPWYSVLGNHDRHTEFFYAQVEYYLRGKDNRWIMPSLYYSFEVDTCDKAAADCFTAAFFMLDTAILAPDAATIYPIEDADNKRAEQLAWLEGGLRDAVGHADWIFVAGHYPVFSTAEHGDTESLKTHLLPLLERYEVDAYFCGHDHSLQAFSYSDVEFYVSGNGGKRGYLNPWTGSATLRFARIDPGFTLHEVSRDTMRVSFVNRNGTVVYSFAQPRRLRAAADGDDGGGSSASSGLTPAELAGVVAAGVAGAAAVAALAVAVSRGRCGGAGGGSVAMRSLNTRDAEEERRVLSDRESLPVSPTSSDGVVVIDMQGDQA